MGECPHLCLGSPSPCPGSHDLIRGSSFHPTPQSCPLSTRSCLVAYVKAELSQRLRLSVVFYEMLAYGRVGTVVTEAGPEHLQLLECLLQESERADG